MSRILIVDDNAQNLYMLEALLTGHGHDVIKAVNGQEALTLAKEKQPDLIISDILMPVMDGFEMCRQLRADPVIGDTPLVFYTATYTDPKDERFALSLGADRFVIKPQDPDLLLPLVEEVIRERLETPVDEPDRSLRRDEVILKDYSEVLFRKLEKKVKQLEEEILFHKKAKEELLRSETRYRQLFESAKDGLLIADVSTGEILNVNNSIVEMFGFGRKELNGKVLWEVESFRKIVSSEKVLAGFLSIPNIRLKDIILSRRDGTRFYAEIVSCFYLVEGNKVIQFNIRDISERKELEISHEKEQQRINGLLEIFRLSISAEIEIIRIANEEIVKLTGSELACICLSEDNGAILRLFMRAGNKKGQYQKEDTTIELPVEDAGFWTESKNSLDVLLLNDILETDSHRLRLPKGCAPVKRFLRIPVVRNHQVLLMGAVANKSNPYTDDDIQQMRLFLEGLGDRINMFKAETELLKYRDHLEELVRERTEELETTNNELNTEIAVRKGMEEQLKNAIAVAETANKAKTVFLSRMSHEIRTPLNAVLGFSQLMLRDSAIPDRHREWLSTINRAGEHLLTIINDILEISKIESGLMTLNPETIDLTRLLNDIEKMFRCQTDEKGIDFKLETGKTVPRFISIDGNKLRQILINLLGNAVKFTDTGIIKLSVSAHKGWGGNLRLMADVEDSGPGIPPEEKDRVFESFGQQVLNVRKGGSGLGLSISRQFARKMGGDLVLLAKKGQGSLFRLEVDCCEEKGTALPDLFDGKPIKGLESGQKGYRILVVDDEAANRKLLTEILTQTGFETDEASNGLEAVKLFKSREPDLVFLDMRMPEMDGFETIKTIRGLKKGSAVPIVAVTASAFLENRTEILQTGVNGYIRKPFMIHEIFTMLQTLLGVRYTYEEDPVNGNDKRLPFRSDDLRKLPENLIGAILKAAKRLDLDLVLEGINEIEPSDHQTAEYLRRLAKSYQYEELIRLLSKGGS